MPDILKQVGPQQYQFLKTQLGNLDQKSGAAAKDDDDEDVPELVGTFEDAGKKQEEENKQEQPSQEASASLTKAIAENLAKINQNMPRILE